jgi:transcription initiation factor TFIID TATA-box-binding protein
MNIIHEENLPDAHVVNVVATYHIGCRLNLRKIAYMRRDIPVKFNPTRFAAMTLNVEAYGLDPTTALIFASGNVVHTGAKTEDHSRNAAHYLIGMLNSAFGIPAWLNNFTITNMVCDMKVGFEVNLETLKKELGSRAKYVY